MSNQTFRLRFLAGPLLPLALWLLLVSAVTGGLLGLAKLDTSSLFPFIIFFVFGAAFGIYFQAVQALSFTDCTDTEIRTRFLVRTRHCPWQDISDITVERRSRGRRPARSVLVTTTAGKRISLAAPFDGELVHDPHFDAALNAIRTCWRMGVGQLAQPIADTYD
jgi:hypothetical protein